MGYVLTFIDDSREYLHALSHNCPKDGYSRRLSGPSTSCIPNLRIGNDILLDQSAIDTNNAPGRSRRKVFQGLCKSPHLHRVDDG